MQEQGCIPKVIHYVWFGGKPLPPLAEKCIESWKKFCPDYEIVRWDENNFDINYNQYVKEAYVEKKWAFVSDVVRLYALVNYGGIYMDTDVEVIKPLDDLLNNQAFSGFESQNRIPTGLIASVKGQAMLKEFLDEYDNLPFIKQNGEYDLTTNVERITNCCLKYGLVLNNTEQTVNGFKLYPYDYLCPLNANTRKWNITDNTYTIHHFSGSWLSDEEKHYVKLFQKYNKFLPSKVASYLAKFNSVLKFQGFKCALKQTFKWLKKLKKDKKGKDCNNE